jgi:ABC-type nitrate/sulfonate/bicarbonate transport systems, periplasmic components
MLKKLTLWTTAFLFSLHLCGSGLARAETFTVGYIPYDTISYNVIVNNELGLWKKYLPQGTELQFEAFITGPTLANTMLAGRTHIGYISMMPAVILCSKPDMARIKMAATLGISEGTRSSVLLVRKDAPEFKDYEDLARWLDGKVIASPRGSGSDQFLRRFFAKYNVNPKEYLNQNIEAIATNFRGNKLDAAACWEPTLSRIAADVGEGYARIVADGRSCDNPDVGVLMMRADFMEQHPEVAKGYLKAELEAQRYILNPENQASVIEMVSKYATGIPKRILWYSIFGKVPVKHPDPIREWKNYYFTERERDYVNIVTPFLLEEKVINTATLPEGTIDDALARQVFKESGYTPFSDKAVLGVINGRLASECPFND